MIKAEKFKLRLNFFIIIISFLIICLILNTIFVSAPPSPHNVQGRVFSNGTNGVQNGIPVMINDTVSNDLVIVYTDAPEVPELLGTYSAAINGSDGDLIIVTAWNLTHYGMNSSLLTSTTELNIVLNTSRPSETNVTITAPQNKSIHNTTNVFNLTANVSVAITDATLCNATLSFSQNQALNITTDQNFTNLLGNIAIGEVTTTTWNLSGLKEGFTNVTVTGQCSSDGINLEKANIQTILIFINDTSPPVINLTSPANNSWVFTNLTFSYSIIEGTGIKNCSLLIDDKLNQTSYKVQTLIAQNFTLNDTSEGQHNWSISCFDNSSNFLQGNSSFGVFYADGHPPGMALLFPPNGSALTNTTVTFYYNVTDNFNATNCSLIINNEIRETNHTISLNISNNFTATLSGNNYNWSVNCSDNANNIGDSSYFVLTAPDLKINSSDISFSNNNPVEKEQIEINATIYNLGTANTTNNVTFRFFENDPYINGVQLGLDFNINVTAGSNVTVTINYTTKRGNFNIFAVVDPPLLQNGSVVELNESNNEASRQIFISAYNVYHGIISSTIVLDASQNLSVFSWVNVTALSGQVFAADSDSNIDFSNLLALSRNLTGNFTFNDFEELDLALNMTNLTDSINNTYTIDGGVKNSANLTVYLQSIYNVPIINSTNNSNFITGILWDKSDEAGDGQYNGSEDVLFITQINKNSPGAYGTYDYEIKVPSTLKQYMQPNVQDTITFYRELR